MQKVVQENVIWQNSNIQVFWGEIAPCDHLVQVYDNDKIFLDTLEGFVGSGFLAGDSVIIIASASHLNALNKRLRKHAFNLDSLIKSDQYIPLEAEETLSKLLVKNWPDEQLFSNLISQLIERAGKNDRKIRAFGEMVAILWEQGHNGATVQLENLWNQLHHKKPFQLFCAYPKSGFTQCANHSIEQICQTHSKVINGSARPSTEIYFRNQLIRA